MSNLLSKAEIMFTALVMGFIINVPLAKQYPSYPSGCEAYATVAVLKHNKVSVSEKDYISGYLPQLSLYDKRLLSLKEPFDTYFIGDPANKRELGLYANPPVLVKSANKYLKQRKVSSLSAVDISGVSFRYLVEDCVLNDIPAVIWLTVDDNPRIKRRKALGLKYISSSHTVVLAGYNAKAHKVYLIDSIRGKRWMSYKKAEQIYNSRGKLSFVIKEIDNSVR